MGRSNRAFKDILLLDPPQRPATFVLATYLGLLVVAELLAAGLTPLAHGFGVWLHALLLLALLGHSVLSEEEASELYLAMAILPLIRVLSFVMPLWLTDQAGWFAMVNLPLIIGTVVAARILGYSRYALGLRWGWWPVQLMIAASGIPLGYVERLIIQPPPLVPSLEWQVILWPAISLILFTGLSEELLFRGVLQQAAIKALGAWPGILFVSLMFGAMHIGWHSALDVLFVTVVGAFFGFAVYRTGSIFGVTLAHGLVNIMLFIILPHTVG